MLNVTRGTWCLSQVRSTIGSGNHILAASSNGWFTDLFSRLYLTHFQQIFIEISMCLALSSWGFYSNEGASKTTITQNKKQRNRLIRYVLQRKQ